MRFKSRSEEETMRVAAKLARRSGRGMVVLLDGPLGSGKTVFVRGFLRALGFRGPVPSPTFTLINEYRRVRPPVYHMDMYRLGDADLDNLGLEEYFEESGAVTLVEWPGVLAGLAPQDRVEVSLSHLAGEGRGLRLRGTGPRSKAALRSWRR